MGPFVLLHVALIGFFAGAAIHAVAGWWLSRRDHLLAAFGALCLLCALVTGAWVAAATAADVEAARAAIALRYVSNLLYLAVALGMLQVLALGRMPRVGLTAVAGLAAAATVFLVTQPQATTPVSIAPFTYPWGERISVIVWTGDGWWPIFGFVAALALSTSAAACAWLLATRDRLLALFLGVTGASGLVALAAALWASEPQRSPYLGTLPLGLWVGLFALYFGKRLTGMRDDLERSERQFRTLFDGLNVGIVLQDAGDHILLSNPAAARMLGLTEEQLRGITSRDPGWKLVREDGSDFPPAEVPSVVAARERRAVHNVVLGATNRNTGKRVWLQVTAAPELRADGTVRHVIVTLVDVTDRKLAEEALRASERRLSMAISATSDAVWEVDYQAETAYYSPRWYEMLGCSPDLPMTVDTWRSLCHPDDVEPTLAAISLALEREQKSGYEVEFRMKRADGSWMWILGRGNVVERDPDGTPRLLAGTNTDITARKEAEAKRRELEARLAQSERMEAMGRLAGGIAHDFNNLLTVINGYSDLLISTGQFDQPTREMLADIRHAGDRAASLTKQLLTFSRRQVVAPDTLDLNQVVLDTERMLTRLIGEHIVLATTLAPSPVWVRSDVGQLGQVIVNLAVNGRDAMPRGGALSITTTVVDLTADEAIQRSEAARAGRYAAMSVTDTGIGIPVELQPMVFEPFFTTKPEGQGTGLGLSTVHGIMQQCAGFLTVESTPGRGSRFTAYFPLTDPPAPSRDRSGSAAQPSRTRTVLLAEDDDGVRPVVEQMLQHFGFEVIAASGGNDALRIAARHPGTIDLLLTDVVMPDLPGPELARRVALIRPDLPVLYMSGYTNDPFVRELAALPDAAFLQKPFDAETLIRKVREAMDAPPTVI